MQITNRHEAAQVLFSALDQNKDNLINASEANVRWAEGMNADQFEAALTARTPREAELIRRVNEDVTPQFAGAESVTHARQAQDFFAGVLQMLGQIVAFPFLLMLSPFAVLAGADAGDFITAPGRASVDSFRRMANPQPNAATARAAAAAADTIQRAG